MELKTIELRLKIRDIDWKEKQILIWWECGVLSSKGRVQKLN